MGLPEQHLLRAIEIDPSFVDARYQLALLQRNQGRVSDASEQLAQLLEIQPEHTGARYLHSTILAETGQFREARASFESLLEEEPRHAEAHYQLGVLHMDCGSAHDAVYHLEKASTLDADNADAHYRLARLHPSPEDFEKSRALLETAVDYEPSHIDAHFQLGIHLRRGFRYDSNGTLINGGFDALARESFQNVLKLDPCHSAAHEELADLLCVVGDKSSAVKSYNAAISNDPTRISTYLKLAKVQNTESAFKTLFNALKQDSDNPFVHLRIAKLFLADSQDSLACEHFNRAAEESIVRMSSLRAKAKEALDGNQFHLSRSLEDQACEIAVHRAEALFQLGLLFLNDPLTARKYFETAISTFPEHADSFHQLAIIQNTEGDSEAAIESLRKSVEIEIQNSEAHYLLAQLLLAAGETEMARNHFLITLDLEPRHKKAIKELSALPSL